MFRDRFVACLKVKGEILREDKETVRIPFGSEYTLFLRNYNSRRAVVRVEIDGQDALDGRRLVVEPNNHLELERFIKNGDLTKGNRFRFIHKSEKIKAHRGDKVDDGIVRISWQWEAPAHSITFPWGITYYPGAATASNSFTLNKTGTSESVFDFTKITQTGHMGEPCGDVTYSHATGAVTTGTITASYNASNSVAVGAPPQATATTDEGITVPGAESRQSFGTVYVPNLEPEEHVMVLKLLGESPTTGQAITQPLTVKEKLECPTCGTSNKSSHRFCSDCGTCLGD